jgi:biotin carboxylase
MKRILFVFPTHWDRKQLDACRADWHDRYEVLFAEPADEECPASLDPVQWLEQADERWRGHIDGVTSSSDYPGATMAAALADRLGLPGPPPASVLRASHKYYSRMAQRESVPEATPRFALLEPRVPLAVDPGIGYPCFLKPIKGAFSVMSGKVRSRAELEAFLARPSAQDFLTEYVALFNRLLRHLTDLEVDGSRMLVEEFLRGRQVTVEGWASGGEVHVLGIVDSILHPDVPSFARFDYPSVRRAEIQEEMARIARRAILHLGLDQTLFNIEMIYEPASDRIHIIEINPRLCGQFADLYHKVDGVSGYEVALVLAAGDETPVARGGGRRRMASSFPLRTFRPVRVRQAPDDERVAAVEALFGDTLVWLECRQGAELSDFEAEDGRSCRYAVVNVGADSRAELRGRLESVTRELGIVLEPATTTGGVA